MKFSQLIEKTLPMRKHKCVFIVCALFSPLIFVLLFYIIYSTSRLNETYLVNEYFAVARTFIKMI